MGPEDREIEPVGNGNIDGNGVNARYRGCAGGSDSSKKFESEIVGAFVDKIGDAVNDIAAAAVRELIDTSSASYDSRMRRRTRQEMSTTAVAVGSIIGGTIASAVSDRGTIEVIAIWCSVAIVNVTHLAYHYISLKFSSSKAEYMNVGATNYERTGNEYQA